MRSALPALFVAAASLWGQDIETEIRSFTRVYAAIESQAADPIDPAKAIYGGAIPAMLRPLDPHSVFFDPDQFEQLQKLQESVSKGFGSVVNVLPGRPQSVRQRGVRRVRIFENLNVVPANSRHVGEPAAHFGDAGQIRRQRRVGPVPRRAGVLFHLPLELM